MRDRGLRSRPRHLGGRSPRSVRSSSRRARRCSPPESGSWRREQRLRSTCRSSRRARTRLLRRSPQAPRKHRRRSARLLQRLDPPPAPRDRQPPPAAQSLQQPSRPPRARPRLDRRRRRRTPCDRGPHLPRRHSTRPTSRRSRRGRLRRRGLVRNGHWKPVFSKALPGPNTAAAASSYQSRLACVRCVPDRAEARRVLRLHRGGGYRPSLSHVRAGARQRWRRVNFTIATGIY